MSYLGHIIHVITILSGSCFWKRFPIFYTNVKGTKCNAYRSHSERDPAESFCRNENLSEFKELAWIWESSLWQSHSNRAPSVHLQDRSPPKSERLVADSDRLSTQCSTPGGPLKCNVVSRRDQGYLKYTLNKYFLLKPKYTLNADFTCFLTNFTPLTSYATKCTPKQVSLHYIFCLKYIAQG